MNKNIIVISTLVDNTAKTEVEDSLIIFNTIEELKDYVDTAPLRADAMYITRDSLGEAVNTSLTMLLKVMESPFIKVTETIYVTEKDSPELESVKFMNEQYKMDWTIHLGLVNRNYLIQLLSGIILDKSNSPLRRNVYIVDKEDYIRERIMSQSSDKKFKVEEDTLGKLPNVEVPEVKQKVVAGDDTRILQVSGLKCFARHVFVSLLAQHCSLHGKKVILIERDKDYLALTDIMYKSGVEFDYVRITDLYKNTDSELKRLGSRDNMITLVGDNTREEIDYDFLLNFIYSNISGRVDLIIMERELSELSPSTQFITVIENDVSSILETTEKLPLNKKEQTKFVLLNTKSVNEVAVPNTEQLKRIIGDLVQKFGIETESYKLNGLRIGGDIHDLSSYYE